MSAAFTPGPWKKLGYCGFWIVGCGDRPRYPKNHICRIEEARTEAEANARLIAAAPDGYDVAGAFIMAAINEYDIPEDADEGWILDTLGHGMGGAYLEAVAFRAKARGEQP